MKFSIRQMLIAMIGFAFYAAVIGAGANGSPIGYSLAVASAMLLIIVAVLGTLYWLAFAVIAYSRRRTERLGSHASSLEINATEEST